MSASRERKMREEKGSSTQEVTKKKTKKLSEGWIFTICIVAVVVLVFGSLFIVRNHQMNKAVLTVGDHDVKVGEFNYFYREFAANCDAYAQYIGIEKNVPMDQQKLESDDLGMLPMLGINTDCMKDLQPTDGVYDFTWADLIAYNAMRSAATSYSIYQAAMDAGYEVTEEDAASIDGAIEMVSGYAEENHVSVDEYLGLVFGSGSDEKSYRQYLEVVTVAGRYPSTLEYTEEERNARYEKDPAKFDTADFYYYSVNASALKPVEGDEEKDKEEKPEEDYDAKAKAEAEKMAKNFDVENEKVKIYADMSKEQMEQNVGVVKATDEARTWIFETAKEGKVKMFTVKPEAEDGEDTYVVIKMIARGNYDTSDYLQIVIPADAADKELAEGELSAKEKVEAIEASLKEDPSEENFRKNMREYLGHTHEDGTVHDGEKEGLVENMNHAQMATVSNSFYAWAAMSDRKAGDQTVDKQESSTRFYFYLGKGENFQKLIVSGALKQEWYQITTEAAIAACEYDPEVAMHAKVGYYA